MKNVLEALGRARNYNEIVSVLRQWVGDDDILDLDNTTKRNDMDTFGNLVDKLMTVNLKMWHNQELLYEIRHMTPEKFEEKYGSDLRGLHKIIDRCCSLNVQRSALMDEVDKFLADAIQGSKGRTELVREQHKMY